MKKTSVYALVLGGICASPVWADELLWWVTSDKASEVVPLYEGAPTPFPVKEAPIEEKKTLEEENALSEDQLKNLARRGQLLTQIRHYLNTGKFNTPNIYSVVVSGYLEGESGPTILVDKVWYKEGDRLAVPAEEYDYFRSMVNELKGLSEEAYNLIAPDIEGKMRARQEFRLKIQHIEKGKVTFTDQEEETYVISFSSSNW